MDCYDKKYFISTRFNLQLQLQEILNEVDEELDNWWDKGEFPQLFDLPDTNDKPRPTTTREPVTTRPKKVTAFDVKDKQPTKTADDKKGFFTRLFEHPCK